MGGRNLPGLARLEKLGQRGIHLGLAAIDAVCARLGRPERAFPSILIGGTNGKGSTAATLSAIAAAHGVSTGLYTSPHLIDVTERVRLEERDVEAGELDAALSRVFAAADSAPSIPVTYFEAATAAAFQLFALRSVSLGILEVGLGGRLDATNVAPASVSVVTSIGLDHMADLGETLGEIAREKAGIFRRGRPALARAASAAARATLREAAERAGSIWHDAEEELRVEPRETSLEGTRFTLTTPERRIDLSTPLPGEHQAWNAALAVRAGELLGSGLPALDDARIARGIAQVRWPGRLERFDIWGKQVLLDGCHNPEGAEALARFLRESGLAGRFHLVFGAMSDKDIAAIARTLFPLAAGISLVTVDSPRAASAEDLARVAPAGVEARVETGRVGAVLGDLLARGLEAPIIVAGSLYLVGEARAFLLAAGTPEGTR
jgi:dihydrofolate synthase/folylpolyglutamate synthase